MPATFSQEQIEDLRYYYEAEEGRVYWTQSMDRELSDWLDEHYGQPVANSYMSEGCHWVVDDLEPLREIGVVG